MPQPTITDPYLNVDAGTMSPFEHGEVFVLDDGGEVGWELSCVRSGLSRSLGARTRILHDSPASLVRAQPRLAACCAPVGSPAIVHRTHKKKLRTHPNTRPTSTWATTSASSTSRSRATTTSRRARSTRCGGGWRSVGVRACALSPPPPLMRARRSRSLLSSAACRRWLQQCGSLLPL